jgi:hypothetical protein
LPATAEGSARACRGHQRRQKDGSLPARAGARAVTLAGDVVEVRRRETISDLCAFDLTPGFEA